MSDAPEPQPGILDIRPYEGGESRIDGRADAIKLSSNENPHGPSPAARAAILAAADGLAVYPSADHAALRAAIGAAHGLDPARIVCGAGSDEIIALLCQGYAGSGTEVIHTEHGFAMHRISAMAAGARPVEAPERERVIDADAILDRAGPATRLVFVTVPANPTGTMMPAADLSRLARDLPAHVLLVIDGAYADYVPGYDGGAALVEESDRVVMTRTFSKIYGLGGLRVGWGYMAPALVDVLNRIRGPFNLSTLQQAAAEAALGDAAHVEWCRSETARLRAWLTATLQDLNVGVDRSFANFVFARFEDADAALACDAHLRREGLIVRRTAGYKLPEGLRITVGDEASCRRVARAIGAFRGAFV